MVISTTPLIELCPVQPAAMEGRQIAQWDKDSCADAGFLKIDLLGLGMLSAVERCVDEIARTRGERIDLSHVPLDDDQVWSAIQRAETTGVFQIESRAQMQMLPRTLPEDLDDLTVQVALVRPGPIQGGAVHPYIERRKRLRENPAYEVPYEHPSLEPALRDTLGAIVFQDQVLEVAMALAGFSVGEAEGLRRAMSRKRSQAAMERYRVRFIEGAIGRGVSREVAERVFGQIEGFSGFGFPKSHSAAFGLLAYQSMWLRVHYGPELLCALLNEQPMGFYPPDALVHEAQRRGLEILPPDVNVSELDCRVETTGATAGSEGNPPVRIGLGYVAEVAEIDARAVIDERRRGGSYRSISDLAGRSGAGAAALQRLAWSGACDGLVQASSMPADPDDELRRPALWEVGGSARATRGDDGAQLALPLDGSPTPPLPQLGPWERIVADYRTTGMTLGKHPMELIRAHPALRGAQQRGPWAHAGRRQGERGRDGGRPPAPGDRQRRRLHAARGRAGHDQPDRPSSGRRALPPGGEDLRLRPGRGQAGAPRGHDQRPGQPHRPPQHRRAPAPADPRARAAGPQGDGQGPGARTRDGRPIGGRPLQARLRRRPRGRHGGARRLPPGPAQLRAPRPLERADRRDDRGEVSPLVEMPIAIERRMRGRPEASPRSAPGCANGISSSSRLWKRTVGGSGGPSAGQPSGSAHSFSQSLVPQYGAAAVTRPATLSSKPTSAQYLSATEPPRE